jgi:hypothetical protein
MTIELLGLTWIQIADIGVGIVNIGILLGLLYFYINSYRQIKVEFTIGLILFASVLLLNSIFGVIFLIMNGNILPSENGFIKDNVGNIIQLIALAILLKITWDY